MASFKKILISSNLFKAEHALKKSKSEPTHATLLTPTPKTPTANAPTAVGPNLMLPGQFPMNPFAFSGGYPMVPPFSMMPNMLAMMYQQNPFQALPAPLPYTSVHLSCIETSLDPPLSPISASCDISTFCKDYDLDETDEARLKHLGFKIGDK